MSIRTEKPVGHGNRIRFMVDPVCKSLKFLQRCLEETVVQERIVKPEVSKSKPTACKFRFARKYLLSLQEPVMPILPTLCDYEYSIEAFSFMLHI